VISATPSLSSAALLSQARGQIDLSPKDKILRQAAKAAGSLIPQGQA